MQVCIWLKDWIANYIEPEAIKVELEKSKQKQIEVIPKFQENVNSGISEEIADTIPISNEKDVEDLNRFLRSNGYTGPKVAPIVQLENGNAVKTSGE